MKLLFNEHNLTKKINLKALFYNRRYNKYLKIVFLTDRLL